MALKSTNSAGQRRRSYKKDLDLKELLDVLSARFLSRNKKTEAAQRFLSGDIQKDSEKFFAMMSGATYLPNKNYIWLETVADKIISRSPPEIRIALWSIVGSTHSMFGFAKAAERVSSLAYRREGSMKK